MDYEKSLVNLSKDPLGLDRRNILIFEIFKNGGINPDGNPLTGQESEMIRKFYQVEPDSFILILLKKNKRHLKRFNTPLKVETVFEYFDGS